MAQIVAGENFGKFGESFGKFGESARLAKIFLFKFSADII